MISHRILEPYKIEVAQSQFVGAHVFSYNNNNLLIEKCGHIILVDNIILEKIKMQDIDEDLFIKLMQRNFIKSDLQIECSIAEKTVRPDFFMIDFTKRCNMSCRYCFRENENSFETTITKSSLYYICEFIINYCKENSVERIMIQPWGGEPLLELDKIYYMQDILIDGGIESCISIETNGLLINEKTAEELEKRNITIGVSLDGIKEVHDLQRVKFDNSGTFEKVINGIKVLQNKIGNEFGIIMTITKNSIPYIEESLNFFAKKLKVNYVKVNFVHKSDFITNDDLCLSSNEIKDCALTIFYVIMKLNEEGYDFYESNIQIRLLNLLGLRNSSICCSCGCSGGKRMIAFDRLGNVYPCELTDYPEERIGNIAENRSLVNMINDAVSEKDYFIEKKEEKCNECPWYYYCQGGCTVQAKCGGKKVGEVDDMECICNLVWYHELVKMILEKPDVVNHFLNSDVIKF